MNRSNVVALIANRPYLPGAFATAASILEADLDNEVSLALVHPPDTLSPAVRRWLADAWPRIELVEVDASAYLPAELSAWDTALAPLFLRFALAEIFPAARRILYVDSDILAVRTVNDAFGYDLGNRIVAAAHDDLVASLVGPKPSFLAYRESLGMPPGMPYLNCGVLLLDGGVWRERAMKKTLVDLFLANRQRCKYLDQSAINLFLKGDFAPLSPAWNFQQNYQAIGAEDLIHPRLLHFAGSAKPWRNDGFVFRSDYRQRYRTVLAATPFETFFQPYWRVGGKQPKEAWRSLNRSLQGRELQSGIRKSGIGHLRKRLVELLSTVDFVDIR